MAKELTKQSIRYHYRKAADMALDVVEKKARAILRRHSNLDEFVMCMGGWWFTRKEWDAFGLSKIIHESESLEGPKYMAGLRRFIDEWDPYLRMTGAPMRFTAEGKVVTEW